MNDKKTVKSRRASSPSDDLPAAARRHWGELEARVMQIVWDAGGWCTPAEVHQVLAAERPLAYTTTMTILVRLWRKGRLERQRDGRAYAYRPPQTREEYAALQMTQLLTGVANRPATLSHFLHSLGSCDRDQIRRILREFAAE